MYHGDLRLGDTIDVKFCTVTTTGAPTTLAGTPVVSAYPGNSTTQLTAGITLTVDFDAVTGLHNVRVVASSGNGYATATTYALVITTGTVGGTSVVGYVIGTFSIEARSALMPTTAARTLDVSATGEADANVALWLGTAAATPTVAGVPEVDVTHWIGTAAATPTVAGVPEVDCTHMVGAVVSTSTAQLGVNAVQAGGTAWGSGAITAAAIAADAITAAKIADGAIDAGALAADAITAAKIADGAIDRATFAADTGLQAARSNTAQAGAGGSITLDASASATTDFYVGLIVFLTGGTGVGQARVMTAYNGTSKVATIAPNWATAPDATSTFALITFAQPTGVQGNLTGSVGSLTTNNDKTGYSVGVGGIAATAFAAGAIDAAAIAADAIGASELAASAVDEILDDTIGDGTITVRQALRVLVAALAGKLSGAATTTVTIRNTADSANVIVATVDADGNRSAVTVTP